MDKMSPLSEKSLTAAEPAFAWASVEVGPPLPLSVYTCAETWNPERIGAMAVYCSDGRWGEAFDEFCHKRLLLPRYDRWAVPGGPAWLAPSVMNGDIYPATHVQLDFLVRAHALERIVLITHFGCAFYRELLRRPAVSCLAAQMDDLRTVTATLRDWYPNMHVDAYVAMQRGKCLSFHHLDC
jgi:hypothetical protein